MRGFFTLLCPLLLTSLQVCSGGNSNIDYQISLQNCNNPTVEVTNVTILCTSPYSYSYGNSAHQNSKLCDYGDKAFITVHFSVIQDLDSDQHIYMDMGVFSKKENTYQQLYEVRKKELCNTYVGHKCTTAGTYAFAFQASFEVIDGQDISMFLPLVSFGFSTKQDDGYNLGGANIDCSYTEEYKQYVPAYVTAAEQSKRAWGAGSAASSYALPFGVVMLLVAAACFTWWKLGHQIDFQGPECSSFNLMSDASSPDATLDALPADASSSSTRAEV
jgi:hypothetical protein